MKAAELAALAATPEARQRWTQDADVALMSILQACRQAAAQGSWEQFFRVPRQYATVFDTALKSLGYDVTQSGDDLSTVSWTVSWAAAAARKILSIP